MTNNDNNNTNNNNSSDHHSNERSPAASRPIIPDEVGNPDCPVCLNRVQDRAYANRCLHEFCYPCLKEWSRQHNRCPVCRVVYNNILHNIRTNDDYDMETVDEPHEEMVAALVMLGNTGTAMLVTPPNTGVYLIRPNDTRYGLRHDIQFFARNRFYLLNNVNPRTVIASPELVEQVLRQLGGRPNIPHTGRHPPFLRRHRH